MDVQKLETLNRIRKFSRILDTAIKIPGINFRIGLDPILGLVPGVGDLVTTGFSMYLVYLATKFNLPDRIIRQMLFNVILETAVGGIPLLGDLFDAFYKSNIRNLALLEENLQIEDSLVKDSTNVLSV